MATNTTIVEGCGYEPTIFKDPPRHGDLCPICTHIVRHPMQTKECHHVFCEVCLAKWIATCKENGRGIICPSDNEPIDEQSIFHDIRLERELNKLCVYCDNKGAGCEATSTLGDLQDHLMKCAYATVNCPLSCGQHMLLGEIEGHTREKCPCRLVVCQSCREELQSQDLLSGHSDVCAMKEIACDLCAAAVIRQELFSHKETTCPNYVTYCRFAQLGCDQPMERREIDGHHSTNAYKHQSLTLAALSRAYGVLNVTLPSGGSEGVTGGGAGDVSVSSQQTDKTGLELPLGLRRRLYGAGRNVGEGDFGVTAEGLSSTVIDKVYVLGCKVDTLTDRQGTLADKVDALAGCLDSLTKKLNMLMNNTLVKDENAALVEENKRLRLDMTRLSQGDTECVYPVVTTIELKHPDTEGYIFKSLTAVNGYAMKIFVKCTNSRVYHNGDYQTSYQITCYLMKGLYDASLKWPWNGAEGMEIREHDTHKLVVFQRKGESSGIGRPVKSLNQKPLFCANLYVKSDCAGRYDVIIKGGQ